MNKSLLCKPQHVHDVHEHVNAVVHTHVHVPDP